MIRYGTVGTSWITEKFIESANTVDGLRFEAAYSRSREKAEAFAQKNGGTHSFFDLEEMAASPLIDAVYIASPNSLHYEQSLLFLRRGKHVFCEKSVASSPERVRHLLETAEKNDAVFLEAITNTRLPQMELLRQTLPRLGKIRQARFSFCQLSSKYPLLLQSGNGGTLPNIFNPAFEAGAVMDIGVYCVYPALLLFGDSPKVSARGVLHTNGIDLCGEAVLDYGDTLVELAYSKVADGRSPSEIQGDQGTLLIERISQLARLEWIGKEGDRELLFEAPEGELHMRHEARRFLEYIEGSEKYRERYEAESRLAVRVSDVLAQIRRCCGMPF